MTKSCSTSVECYNDPSHCPNEVTLSVSKDAAQIAGGGGIVFAASIIDRGLRLLVTWLLSGALGSAMFGSYTFAITVATIITVFSPLGLDVGAIYFGAQYRKAKAWSKTKGLVIDGLLITTFSGFVCAAILWIYAPTWFTDVSSIRWIAPSIAIWTPLLFMIGLLRSVKDMRSNALSIQLTLPAGMFLGACAVSFFSLPLQYALLFFSFSLSAALAVGTWRAWKHFGGVLRNSRIKAVFETGKTLRYSLPQGLAAMVFRLNLWMDILMLGYLSSNQEIGLYKIAASLAVIAGLPVSALVTIFNPFIAELVAENQREKLNQLLQITTRWLITLSLPILMLLFILPDLALMLFKPEYMASQTALQILIAGQVVWVTCALAMRLIPMSGHTTLNLINGVFAALLNIALNWWLIPSYGSIGAAMATAITLSAWSLWRLIEIWWLLRCFPFHRQSFITIALAVIPSVLIFLLLGNAWLWIRAIALFVTFMIFLHFTFTAKRSKADEEMLGQLSQKLLPLIKRWKK